MSAAEVLPNTNALVFSASAPERLSVAASAAVRTAQQRWISVVSLWELSLKQRIGKIQGSTETWQ